MAEGLTETGSKNELDALDDWFDELGRTGDQPPAIRWRPNLNE